MDIPCNFKIKNGTISPKIGVTNDITGDDKL